MVELNNGAKIEIALSDSGIGQNSILLTLPLGYCPVAQLTPQQARMLANEIIRVVNKAEVRANLQQANNLRRNETTPAPAHLNELGHPALAHS